MFIQKLYIQIYTDGSQDPLTDITGDSPPTQSGCIYRWKSNFLCVYTAELYVFVLASEWLN